MTTQDGDSATAQAFGIKGEAISTENVVAPQVEEQEEGQEEVEDGVVSATAPKGDENALLLEKKARDNHKLVIDSIDHQFKLMQSGKLSKDDLQVWFKENPAFAEIANKSKRIKDSFRSLMEEKSVVPIKETHIADENKPLTMADLKRWELEKEQTLQQKTLQTEREKVITTFAASKKIVDDDFTSLKATTNALADVNKSWSYEEAAQAAYRALFSNKKSPLNVSGSMIMSNSQATVSEEDDFTQGVQLMTMDEFSGKKK